MHRKILLGLVFSCSATIASASSDVIGINVLDGDSIEIIKSNSSKELLRLSHIDAPESIQSNGYRSARNLHKLISGNESKLKIKIDGTDHFNRKNGTIYLDGKNLNLQQVFDGYAWINSSKAPEAYTIAQKAAIQYKRGLWMEDNPTPPWKFRNSQK